MQQRSIFYLKDQSHSLEFLKALKQDDKDIIVPASPKFELERQERISIPYSRLTSTIVSMAQKVKLLDVKYTSTTDCTIKDDNEPLFSDFAMNAATGLSIEVAPQTARSYSSYRNISDETIGILQKVMRIENEDKPIFYQEWIKKVIFDDSTSPSIRILRLWNGILKDNVELPIRLPDLDSVTSWELLVHDDTKCLSLNIYWDNVTRPILVSKKYAIQEDGPIQREVAILHEMPSDDWTYNVPLSGIRMKIDSTTYTSKNRIIKYQPTMMHASTIHKALKGYSAKHEFVQPTGMHPIYKVELQQLNSKYTFAPLERDRHENCTLMFQLDVPKQIILDKYQLEHKCGGSILDFQVHNGGMDLELPEYKIEEWGGSLTIELNESYIMARNGSFEIPLHLRYGKPLGDYEEVRIPKGSIYWQCEMKDDKLIRETKNSFYNEKDRLGIDKFMANTEFYHIRDSSVNKELVVDVPTANLRDGYNTEFWTLIFIISATGYIMRALFK